MTREISHPSTQPPTHPPIPTVYTLANRLYLEEAQVKQAEARLEAERKANEAAVAVYKVPTSSTHPPTHPPASAHPICVPLREQRFIHPPTHPKARREEDRRRSERTVETRERTSSFSHPPTHPPTYLPRHEEKKTAVVQKELLRLTRENGRNK